MTGYQLSIMKYIRVNIYVNSQKARRAVVSFQIYRDVEWNSSGHHGTPNQSQIDTHIQDVIYFRLTKNKLSHKSFTLPFIYKRYHLLLVGIIRNSHNTSSYLKCLRPSGDREIISWHYSGFLYLIRYFLFRYFINLSFSDSIFYHLWLFMLLLCLYVSQWKM